ncbi:MAG: hypothetical protein R6V35_02320 [Candidatus Nanohaloarchaea archaeon]
MNRQEVLKHYKENRSEIESRLKDFEDLREASERRLFQELSFVIFSSQSSAENSWKAAERIGKDGLIHKSKSEISEILAQEEVQFENRKADYIIKNRNLLSQPTFDNPSTDLKIKSRIKTENLNKTRDWFSENISGLSWKGASHFLRNIGNGDNFAILSQHTVSALADLEVIKTVEPPKNREEYLNIESKVQEFSEEINIDIKALDLVLWSMRTGKVFK